MKQPLKEKPCRRMAFITNNRASQPQSADDPGTTKLLDDHKGPPGQKCPLGRRLKREEDQNQGLDLETAAPHQCRGRYGAVQGPLWRGSPC